MRQTRHDILLRQIERLTRRIGHLEMRSRRYVRLRWAVAIGGLVLTWLVARNPGGGIEWVMAAVSLVVFVAIVVYHRQVKASVVRHELWRQIKMAHVARIARKWQDIPAPLNAMPEMDHPFASDLNLTGTSSVLQLIDTAMSRGGSERLRSWLLYPNLNLYDIEARQAVVKELIPLTRFRDRLTFYSIGVTRNPVERWEGERVLTWLERDVTQRSLLPWVVVLSILAVTNIGLYALHAMGLALLLWPYSLVLYLILYMSQSGAVSELFEDAFRLEKSLEQLRAVLQHLETYRYGHAPHLGRLCAPFWQASHRPSDALKRIVRIAGAASVQRANIFGLLLNLIVPWDIFFAYCFNLSKATIKTHLPLWIDTWYELEALSALATFGYLNPDYIFPELQYPKADARLPVMQASSIGHPLIPADVRVCNDIVLDHLGELVMITGSNMSGKSTFLRTLGVNLCLAYAGAPVNASAMRTQICRVFTCINVSDSVTDGISYFYAEVRRLKALLQALQTPDVHPLFFLIDEIFRGTNNRERLIGSRSYTRALLGENGLGCLSTHDLELVQLSDEVKGIRNFHFREDVVDGRMVFDYRLRLGPCPTTNALIIMEMEGLPVPGQASRVS
jgi:hypothetical protein